MPLLLLPGLAALVSHAFAGPLTEARINQIVNDVRVVEPQRGARQAALQDLIKGDLGVATGSQSRAELLFQDHTLTRLGAETFFTFKPGTRDLRLDRGSMLLQVPKDLGGARIRAASVTASITGTTIMMENLPGRAVKIVVLEGSLQVGMEGRASESVLLRAGKMVIVSPEAKKVPMPVDVDLRKLVRASALIDPRAFKGRSNAAVAALPSMGLIEKEIATQEKLVKEQGVVLSNSALPGAGEETVATLKSGGTDPVAPGTETPLPPSAGSELAPAANRDGDERPRPGVIHPGATLPGTTPLARTPSGSGTIPPPGSGAPADSRAFPGPGSTGGNGTAPGTVTGASSGPPLSPVDPFTTAGFLQPDWTATATASPFAPANNPPVTVALPNSLIFGGPGHGAVFDLTSPLPQLALGGTALTGTIYGGATVDGSAARFAFGSKTNFDAQVKFDARFGIGSESAFPAAGVAMFRFLDQLTLGGSPAFATGVGLRDLALIVGTNVSTSPAGGSLDLSSLHSFTFATGNGSIVLGSNFPVSASAGSGFKFLHLYASGATGYVTLKNQINLPGGGLLVDAQQTILASPAASVNVDHAAFHAGGNIVLQGALTANKVQFNALGKLTMSNVTSATHLSITAGSFELSGGSLTAGTLGITTAGDIAPGTAGVIKAGAIVLKAGGTLTLNSTSSQVTRFDVGSTTQFHAEAETVSLNGDFILPNAANGSLQIGDHGLKASAFSLGGFDSVSSAAGLEVLNLDTRNLGVAGNASIRGDLHVANTAVGGWLRVDGTISPRVGESVTTMHVLKAGSIQALNGLNFKGTAGTLTDAPSSGFAAALDTKAVLFDASGGDRINGANFDGGDALPTSGHEGGGGGTLNVGTQARPIAGKIDVKRPISATTGANAAGVATGGRGGTVNLISNGEVSIGASVKVSDSAPGRASKQGGSIRVESRKTSSNAISVTSSGELLSLLSAAAPGPGGKIEFVSAGGDIVVNGGKVQADKGAVDIRNNGPGGKIELSNATLRGDVVKVGALGPNGQLIIGGGTISADSMLKLYGGTSNGQVRFKENVTLGGAGTKIIAGKTVQIDNGRTVTVGGSSPASVFADTANYAGSGGNGSTSGKFGGAGATTQGFSGRPAF